MHASLMLRPLRAVPPARRRRPDVAAAGAPLRTSAPSDGFAAPVVTPRSDVADLAGAPPDLAGAPPDLAGTPPDDIAATPPDDAALPADVAGAPPLAPAAPVERRDRRWEWVVGVAIAAFVCLVYLVSNPGRHNFYEHFTWQAAAWLEGQPGIRYPVCPSNAVPTFDGTPCLWVAPDGQPYNDFFLDVLPVRAINGAMTGRALIPFPPLPAVVLLPFVAVFGLNTDAQTLAALIGGLDVWLAWWLLGGLRPTLAIRATATLLFGLGTVFWYTSMLGTTWFFAHVVAVAFALVAVGLALRGDRRAVREARIAMGAEGAGPPPAQGSSAARLTLTSIGADLRTSLPRRPLALFDRRQVLVGFVLGLACTARLTIVFGLPFFAFVGYGGTPLRRTLSAGLGAAIPIGALVLYNIVTTGHVFHPAYQYLYEQESTGYPQLGYNPAWSIEDLRYVPQNLALMLGGLPDVLPACAPGDPRQLFSTSCPVIVPKTVGMSILLVTPAYLLAIPALLRLHWARIVTGGAIAVVAIAFANLMHFSQGWVQFGYRFSNDFVAFALPLVALGMMRIGRVRGWVALFVGASIVVNAWGVAWGVILGW